MEHWGSGRELHPQNLGKNRLPEETQMGSAVTGAFAAPLLLAEKPPPWWEGRNGMGRVHQTQCGAGAGYPCPGTQPSPCSCPQDTQGTHSCPQTLSPAGIQRREQDLALTGTKPQQLLCPTAPSLTQPAHARDTAATKGHNSSAVREGEGSLLCGNGVKVLPDPR